MGFQTTGTASEYFAVDASKVTPIPEEMSYEEGAMIEPLAVAVHGVKQVGDVKGMNIAVLGAGPIGNLVAQAAKFFTPSIRRIASECPWLTPLPQNV